MIERIKWIKNVKRDGGQNWAYLADDLPQIFPLHWPNKKGMDTDAKKAQLDDIIVVFQTYKRTTYFTHLVSVVGQVQYDSLSNPKYPYYRNVSQIATISILDAIPKNQTLFKNISLTPVSNGNLCSLASILPNNDIVRIKEDLVNKFRNSFVLSTNEDLIQYPDIIDEEQSDEEGAWILVQHKVRERSKKIVADFKRSKTEFKCEVCGFNFNDFYPNHGFNFIECHHKTPINEGKRITGFNDLALVCSNCHRMLHKKNTKGEYYTIETLSKIIESPWN